MATDAEANKQRAALAALELVASGVTIGVGTGSTVNLFIDALAANPGRVRSAVSSSQASTARLRAAGLAVVDLNELPDLALYVDGADEATAARHLIKGGGGALTREKILAAADWFAQRWTAASPAFACFASPLRRTRPTISSPTSGLMAARRRCPRCMIKSPIAASR